MKVSILTKSCRTREESDIQNIKRNGLFANVEIVDLYLSGLKLVLINEKNWQKNI